MILTQHGIDSLKRSKIVGYVTIGGRDYPYVKIGRQFWIAENLDYKWSGLTVGANNSSAGYPRANYYNNNEATYGFNGNKYGLLYNFPAAKYLGDNPQLLPDGWHIPSVDEFDELISNSGSTPQESCYNLKSKTGWNSNGIDLYGFSIVPAGNYWGDFGNLGVIGFFWTKTVYDSTYSYRVTASASISTGQGGLFTNNNEYSLRLVKNM